MKLLLIFISINLLVFGCKASQVGDLSMSTDLWKTFPKEAYLEDLDELATRLIDTHPQAFEFITEEEFWNLVDEKKRAISSKTSLGEFLWMYSSLISSIGCSHTSLGYFNQEDALLPASLRFPLEAQFINSKLYVTDPLVNVDMISPETKYSQLMEYL